MRPFLTYVVAMLFISVNALAYTSGVADPVSSDPDLEYKSIAKSSTAGVSDEVLKGHVLTYDTVNNNNGHTITRVGENSSLGAAKVACIADKGIATGVTGLVRCISKGFVDFLRYDAAVAISVGQHLCPGADGVAVVCAECDIVGGTNDCRFGNATENSVIISLEAKGSGSGSDLKAIINVR